MQKSIRTGVFSLKSRSSCNSIENGFPRTHVVVVILLRNEQKNESNLKAEVHTRNRRDEIILPMEQNQEALRVKIFDSTKLMETEFGRWNAFWGSLGACWVSEYRRKSDALGLLFPRRMIFFYSVVCFAKLFGLCFLLFLCTYFESRDTEMKGRIFSNLWFSRFRVLTCFSIL